jgi:hypothetical protein
VTAPYYANAIMEVVFHEITSMPTNPTDPQQIHKKRHVGNDIVHIIYSEHSSDYDPTTITSQFNDAHVIVYPLPNGLYRIQIYRKENVRIAAFVLSCLDPLLPCFFFFRCFFAVARRSCSCCSPRAGSVVWPASPWNVYQQEAAADSSAADSHQR